MAVIPNISLHQFPSTFYKRDDSLLTEAKPSPSQEEISLGCITSTFSLQTLAFFS